MKRAVGQKPRLLFVVNADWFFVSHRLRLGKACQAAGYEVHVAGGKSEAAATIEAAGMPFHAVPFDRGGTNPLHDLNTLQEMVALFRRVQPDIVHLVTIKPNLYGGAAARLLRIPLLQRNNHRRFRTRGCNNPRPPDRGRPLRPLAPLRPRRGSSRL